MIHCIDSGAHKDSVVVMLHGAACSHEVWLEQYEHLRKYHRVMLIDLPGHNKSDGDGFDSIEGYVDSVYSKLKEFTISKFVLCGHSMGGAITQAFALKHPEILKGIILCSTGARLRVTHQVFESIENDFNAFIEMSVAFSLAQEADDEIKMRFKNIIKKCRQDVALNDFRACDNFDVMNEIQKIKLPALIVCGENDLLTPLKYSKYLSQNIYGSKLITFPSCGHMVMLEKSKELSSAINEFVNTIS
jgi:pimeloyl-ACP methyl ester carboxylesterase